MDAHAGIVKVKDDDQEETRQEDSLHIFIYPSFVDHGYRTDQKKAMMCVVKWRPIEAAPSSHEPEALSSQYIEISGALPH